MARPSTGVDFKTSTIGEFNSGNINRGGLVGVGVRDYDGEDTNLSPGSDFESPFAEDGNIRNDLFVDIKDPSTGLYVPNPNPNLGFHRIGGISEDGVSREAKVDVDKLKILQSNYSVRSDLQSEEKTVKFTGVENKPVMHALRFNRKLADIDGVGTPDYFFGKRASTEFTERQLLLFRADKRGGQPHYTCEPVPLCTLSDIGPAKFHKTDVDAFELTFDSTLDPFFTDLDGAPLAEGIWISGQGWLNLGNGSVAKYLVTLGTQSSGTYTLTATKGVTVLTTATIAFGATAVNVKSALVALDDGFTAADWTVTGSTGGPYEVTPPRGWVLSGNGSALTTPGSFSVAPVAA